MHDIKEFLKEKGYQVTYEERKVVVKWNDE
jgi:hypothetical protein